MQTTTSQSPLHFRRAWRAPLLLVLLLSFACTGSRSRIPTMESIAASIAGWNEMELWVCGNAATQAQDPLRAAICFSALADGFPESPRRRDALLGAAESWEQLKEWERALARYQEAYDPEAKDALPLSWKIATALYELDRYEEGLDWLTPLAEREDLSLGDRIRARTWVGICKLEMGDWKEAEMDFRRALFLHGRGKEKERVDPYYPAQAQFFLGEVYRLHFDAVEIEQTDDVDRLSEAIEEKAQFLLSAQGHYLRTVRLGHPHWATAAGQRIGKLYEQLHDEMMEAPIPQSLTDSQAELYRIELRKKVRILVRKAIAAYERTLTVAERLGLDTAFVDETRRSLQRMERLLLEELPGEGRGEEKSGQGSTKTGVTSVGGRDPSKGF